MKPKKTSADWYIAATHWLTSMVASVILSVVVIFLIAPLINNAIVDILAEIIVTPILMWLAVKMSASYIEKIYLIKDANKITILSLVYLIIVGGGYRVMGFLKIGVFSMEYVSFILSLFVFYIASKKYIRANA